MYTLSLSIRIRDQLGRSDVLRAAVEVFGAQGVRATRVQDLLESAGVARRTFYKHFRSKEDVLTKLYSFATRELLDAIERARAESSDPLAGLRAALDAYLEFHVTNHAIARVLIEEAIRSDGPLHPLRAKFRRQLIAELTNAARELTGRSLDPYVFVALVSGLEGISLELLASERTSEDVQRARATILGLMTAITAGSALLPLDSSLR